MKISKQQWMLIAGVGILAIVYWFFFRKKKAESGYDENVMIFGNESGYDEEQLDPSGIESGYVKCPYGTQINTIEVFNTATQQWESAQVTGCKQKPISSKYTGEMNYVAASGPCPTATKKCRRNGVCIKCSELSDDEKKALTS